MILYSSFVTNTLKKILETATGSNRWAWSFLKLLNAIIALHTKRATVAVFPNKKTFHYQLFLFIWNLSFCLASHLTLSSETLTISLAFHLHPIGEPTFQGELISAPPQICRSLVGSATTARSPTFSSSRSRPLLCAAADLDLFIAVGDKVTTWSSLFHLFAVGLFWSPGFAKNFGDYCVIFLLWMLWIWVDFAVC